MTEAKAPKVLVIDDRADVAATIAGMCRALGCDADVSVGGRDVARLVSPETPDALIVDVMMPDQDVYEVLKVIAAMRPDMPMLLVTGHGETWLRLGATLAEGHGMRALQTAAKPVRVDVLRRFLAPLLA
jgi:DNA-binding NtrC family response regulator